MQKIEEYKEQKEKINAFGYRVKQLERESDKFSEDSVMNKSERDKYWTELIQTCRVSGLSDYEWCRMNHISISSFYIMLRD